MRTYHSGGGTSKLAVAAIVVAAIGASGGGYASTSGGSGATSTGANVTLGQQMAAQRGWTGSQWTCLNELWTRESGWNADAANPTSNARGIPQNINGWAAYPPGAAAPQIAWGLTYIQGRYGSPCVAWSHETSAGWY